MNSTLNTMINDAPGDDLHGRCELLGPFALFVQAALGALAMLVLFWKRAREHPQRPLLIWFMDVSKQVLGSVLVHIANLLLSMLSSGTFTTEPSPTSLAVVANTLHRRRPPGPPPAGGPPPPGDDDQYHSNPCSFYLLNLAIDTTIGVVFLVYTLRLLHKTLEKCPIPGFRTGITSGYYGDPPKWTWWVKQSSIYFAGLMIMKFFVWVLFALFPWLGRVGDFLLSWTEGNKKVQVFFVMFFFPLVMNAFQYYVIDSYIKAKEPSLSHHFTHEPIEEEPALLHRHHPFDSDSDEEGDKGLIYPARPQNSKKSGQHVEEYDPDYDGQSENHRGSPESGYFGRNSNGRGGRKAPTIASQKSRNSSMMLLPGSRGPSTPGYADEEQSIGGRSGARTASTTFGDDESTLVGRESDR